MICLLSGFPARGMENFRAEEIGDVDDDQRPEFLDVEPTNRIYSMADWVSMDQLLSIKTMTPLTPRK